MELTLNLPEELARRLPRNEDQLALVLHLGLQVLGAEEEDAENDLPPGWRAALLEMQQERRDSFPDPPTVAELMAYHRNQLTATAVDDLLERLILHPQAARDLIDLMEFASVDALATEAATDVASKVTTESAPQGSAALQVFRAHVAQLAEETSPSVLVGTSSEMPREPATAAPDRVFPFPERPYRWMAWAASLLLALGLGWMLRQPPSAMGLDQATVLDVATSRGARSFPVSKTSPEILIVLPRAESVRSGQGSLRVHGPQGVVYEEDFQTQGDPWSRLYVRLPRAHLPAGTYRIEILRDSPGEARGAYWFNIEDPPPP